MTIALDAIAIVDGTLQTATPLIFAALAGLFSEKAGLVDIGIEGKMLAAAFTAAALSAVTGSALLGLTGGIAISTLLAWLHGFACITHRGNQVVSGLAINFLCAGLTVSLSNAWFGQGGQTPPLSGTARFQEIRLPTIDFLRHFPGLETLYGRVLSGHTAFVYLAFVAVVATWWLIYDSRLGLRLRAVGEHPTAVDTAGISVERLRFFAVTAAGVLSGVAGTYLSVAQNSSFSRDMTAGRGYLALAALIFSNWRPGRVLAACLLFGLLDALQIRFQGAPVFGVEVPIELMQALPYVFTVVMLAGLVGESTPPRALGRPYTRSR